MSCQVLSTQFHKYLKTLLFLCIPTATILVIFYQMDFSYILTDFHTSNSIPSKSTLYTAIRLPKGIKEVYQTSILQ